MGLITSAYAFKGRLNIVVEISRREYEQLNAKRRVVILPVESLRELLTIGKLGNSNRVMLPKKLLRRHHIDKLPRKAESALLESEGDVYLIIRLKRSKVGIPEFEEGSE